MTKQQAAHWAAVAALTWHFHDGRTAKGREAMARAVKTWFFGPRCIRPSRLLDITIANDAGGQFGGGEI